MFLPITRDEFYKIPRLPNEIRHLKLALEIHEALSTRPLTWMDLTKTLDRPVEEVVLVLNQLIRAGFVGIHPRSDKKEIRFHWVQTTRGEPALRPKGERA
jgi:hypothetical protein